MASFGLKTSVAFVFFLVVLVSAEETRALDLMKHLVLYPLGHNNILHKDFPYFALLIIYKLVLHHFYYQEMLIEHSSTTKHPKTVIHKLRNAQINKN